MRTVRTLDFVLCSSLYLGSALCAAAPVAHPPLAKLRTEGTHFVDPTGAIVVLRGADVGGSAKTPPFRGLRSVADLDPLAAFGFNVIRLLFTWEAFEPLPGVYDLDYLAYIKATIDAASARGIYTVVDIHQDAFSRFSLGGCGDGFPLWALPPWLPPALPTNAEACSGWTFAMLADFGVNASWQAFYADTFGVRTRYLSLLRQLSAELGTMNGVIGFDLLNEPLGDEVREISPLYADAAAAIRGVAPQAILFISPHALTGGGLPTELPRPEFGQFVYSPHAYDISVVSAKIWFGADPSLQLNLLEDVAAAWKVPLFLGEFGAPGTTLGGSEYIAAVYDHLDGALTSGAQWVYTPTWSVANKDGWNTEDYSINDEAGKPRANFRPRPYPARIAGNEISWCYAPNGSEACGNVTLPKAGSLLRLSWRHDPKLGETDLAIPSYKADLAEVLITSGAHCRQVPGHLLCSSPLPGPIKLEVFLPDAARR